MKLSRYLKGIVLFIIIANCVFTAAMITVYIIVRTEPTTLIISWFGFTTGELGLSALIKKNENNNDNTGGT